MASACKPIPMSALSKDHFAEWPVWSEFYDYDELEEIESWGVSVKQFLADIEQLNLGNEHAAYPMLKLDPIPDRMRVYIKAQFTCSDGRKLDGYVINEGTYAFCIFVNQDEFFFNLNLEQMFQSSLQSLAYRVESTINAVKPVSFETGFFNTEGTQIAGNLHLP